MKIGPVDTEIALLIVKKEEITEGKIYTPVGNLAERAKKYFLEMKICHDNIIVNVHIAGRKQDRFKIVCIWCRPAVWN